jgi:hypothetical protein
MEEEKVLLRTMSSLGICPMEEEAIPSSLQPQPLHFDCLRG